MMKCSLLKEIPDEHEKITDSRYAETFVDCPLFGNKQICLWCCLHISDLAGPMTRAKAQENYPGYLEMLRNTTGRDLDSIQETCYRCRSRINWM